MLRDMFPCEDIETIQLFVCVVQWFFGTDYIFFTLARLNDFETFKYHCCRGLHPHSKWPEVKLLPSDDRNIVRAWSMFQALPQTLLQNVYEKLPAGREMQTAFRGLKFASNAHLERFLAHTVVEGFRAPESFSTSVATARMFYAASEYSSVHDMGLGRMGYPIKPPGQHAVLLMCVDYYPLHSAKLNCTSRKGEEEVWLRDKSVHLLAKTKCADEAAPVLRFLEVDASCEDLILQELEMGHCELVVLSRTDRTKQFEAFKSGRESQVPAGALESSAPSTEILNATGFNFEPLVDPIVLEDRGAQKRALELVQQVKQEHLWEIQRRLTQAWDAQREIVSCLSEEDQEEAKTDFHVHVYWDIVAQVIESGQIFLPSHP